MRIDSFNRMFIALSFVFFRFHVIFFQILIMCVYFDTTYKTLYGSNSIKLIKYFSFTEINKNNLFIKKQKFIFMLCDGSKKFQHGKLIANSYFMNLLLHE